MASGKDAKQRRQAQNRAQRERLAARSDAAKTKASPSATSSGKGDGAPKSRWQKLLGPPPARASSGSAAGTPARARQGRPGPAFLRRFGYEEPGGRAVHFAVVLTVAASVMALLYPTVPLDAAGHAAKKGEKVVSKVTLLHYQGAKALLLIGAPVVVALITVLLSRPGTRKRTWGFGALALFIWVILGGIGIFYFVPAAAMGFGWWQAGKEEREARMAQAQKAREQRLSGAKGGRASAAAKPASPFGGLFKRRDVVDTTATEVDDDVAGPEDLGEPDPGDDAREVDAPTADAPAERARRPKPTKADVAAAIEAGRRGQRRGSGR